MVGIDAFQTEFLADAAALPLAKSVILARKVIQDICKIIQKLPSYLSQCGVLIETILAEYLEKCLERCGYILSTSDSTSEEDIEIASFKWARNKEILQILKQRAQALDLDVRLYLRHSLVI